MDERKLQKYFSTLQDAFLGGRFAELETYFALPLVVYTPAGVIVARDTDELLRLTEQYRSALIALDVAKTETTIESFDQPVGFRRRAVVRYEDLTIDGHHATRSLIRYFLVEKPGAVQIEMMEYLESPLQMAAIERIVH